MTETYPQKQLLFSQNRDLLRESPPVEIQVAIITRTQNRPLLLRRALSSVLAQRYQNWQMVIVNDGGKPQDVVEAVKPYQALFKDRLKIIHHDYPKGMDAASNAGIRETSSRYIVIHDDDDSWHPDFLSETVAFLESDRSQLFGGVISYTTQINEEVVENEIQVTSRERYNPSLQTVILKDILLLNQFPLISFLFRREIAERIGLFNEDLPVLGDWEFNIRMLLHRDIGVVPQQLAYYHHRNARSCTYGNSQYNSASKHREYDTLIRNSVLRKTLQTQPEMLGLLVNSSDPHFPKLNSRVEFLYRLAERAVKPLRWIWVRRSPIKRGLRSLRLIS